MDPIRNPFVPGAGAPPPELVGREALLERLRVCLHRVQARRAEKCMIAVGLRGVGKTVLLNHARSIAEQLNFTVIYLEVREQGSLSAQLATEMRRATLELDRLGAVNEHAKRALRVFRGWLGSLKLSVGDMALELGIDPELGVADSGIAAHDLPDMFVALGRAAVARGRGVAIILDELQYLDADDLGALIMALHRTAQLGLPVTLIGAGLPLIVGLSGEAKSYAERLFDFPAIGALPPEAAARAIAVPVEREGAAITPAALKAVLHATQGYPYFLQEWGYQSWNAAASSTINESDVAHATAQAIRRLDEGFFRVRFDRLTPREKDYLRAMAAIGPGPHRSGDIAGMLDRATTEVGLRRETLIRKGMIWSPSHGDTAFTVPLFDDFLRRIMPDWSPPQRQPK